MSGPELDAVLARTQLLTADPRIRAVRAALVASVVALRVLFNQPKGTPGDVLAAHSDEFAAISTQHAIAALGGVLVLVAPEPAATGVDA